MNYSLFGQAPVLTPAPNTYQMAPQPQPSTCYMILKQEGNEARGAPAGMFSDPFKARAVFDSLPVNMVGAFTGGGGYYQLVAYAVDPTNGALTELQFIGQK
jgi:hypothetical protein